MAKGEWSADDQQRERLALYQVAVEMADRVSARRTSANTFFLAINSAVVTAIGLALDARPASPGSADAVVVWAIAVAGVALAFAWWALLRSYRDLNRAKFKVILEMERGLVVRPFTDEWAALQEDPVVGWRGRYAELGTIERVVPLLFGVVYLLLAWRITR